MLYVLILDLHFLSFEFSWAENTVVITLTFVPAYVKCLSCHITQLGDLDNWILAWVHGEVSIGVFFALGVVPEVDRHGGEGFQAD